MPEQSLEDLVKQYGGTIAPEAPSAGQGSLEDLVKQYGGTVEPSTGVDVLDNPANRYSYTTPEGVPVYAAAARLPQGQQAPEQTGFLNTGMMGQFRSGAATGAAGAVGLGANIFDLLNASHEALSKLWQQDPDPLFKQTADLLRQKQAEYQKQAAELGAGKEDLGSKLLRTAGGALASLPAAAGATVLGGPVSGFAMLGALEAANQGPQNILKAAAEGAVTGKFMDIMGPAKRLIRVPAIAGGTYLQLVGQGVDPETAWMQATTMGALSGLHPGTVGVRGIPRMLASNLPEMTIPPVFRNRNPAQREAMGYLANEGVNVNAPAASGSRFLGGLQRASEATPIGAVIGETSRQQTVEGVRALSGRLEQQATPETPPGEFYDKFYEAEKDPANLGKVPTGKKDAEGNPTFTDMAMPVPVGLLKGELKPLFEQMQWMPVADRNTSAGYQAIKKILEGPDYIPASQAEFGLSGIKTMGREGAGRNQGIAKNITPKLQDLIDRAVQRTGGDEPLEALQGGRKAAAQQAGADWLKEGFDKARAEGEFNRQDFLWNRWLSLPEEARRTMYTPKQVSDLNNFFLGVKNLFRNVNPSGTAQVSAIGHLLAFTAHPVAVTGEVLGGAAIAKLLNSKFGVKLLTEGMKVGGDTLRGQEIQRQILNITGPNEPPEGPGEPPGGPGGPPPPPGAGAAPPDIGSGPEAALKWAQAQTAAGNVVKSNELQRRFRLKYVDAQKVLKDAKPQP